MKTKTLLVSFMALIAVNLAWSAGSKRVGDFALLDHQGYFHNAAYYDNYKAIALLVQANDSKATVKALPQFQALASGHEEAVKFFLLNPTGNQSRESVAKQATKYDTDLPILIDHSQLVAEAMGIEHTGEAILFSPKTFTVLYRGDVAGLAKAIDNVLADAPVATPYVATAGDAISYPAMVAHKKSPLSYTKDVAPILAENCARCHREGGIGPFAMNSHAMIQGWAPMIREVVMAKRMPPGQVDPHVGDIINTYALSPEQSQTLVHWIEAGAKKDGDIDPLTQLEWPESVWAFGEPDLIINVPPQDIPATGVLDYIRVTVPIEGLEEDRWVRASQYVAGDRSVLHHTLNRIIPPGAEERRRGFVDGDDNDDEPSITAYIPGADPYHEPPNTGGLLRKGSKISLQLHYTTNGKATTDASRIGVWFYPKGVVPEERMSGQCACIFTPNWVKIPPYEADHEMTRAVTLPKDAYLYSMTPHMHFRGKRMRFYAEYPDGNKEEILNIAKYNYAWQMAYTLREPKFLPAGTKMIAVGAFDNSEQNKANPDPAREVPWGQQSWDEMFFGAMRWKFAESKENAEKVSSRD